MVSRERILMKKEYDIWEDNKEEDLW